MNGSQFTGSFKAIIQIYKLGQCKTCLFKIISFGISDYKTFFFLWPNCTSTGESMLSLERNEFILSAQQDDLASWKTSFFFNSMNAFNQKKNVFEISFWKKLFQYLRSLGTFRRSGNCFSEVPDSPAACVSPGFDMASFPLR